MVKNIFLRLMPFLELVIVFGTVGVSYVHAAGPVVLPSPFSGTIVDVLDRIIGFLVAIAIPITVIMILIGAFYMLTAGGSAEQFRKGTKTITYAVVGLIVVFLARGSISLIRELITGSGAAG